VDKTNTGKKPIKMRLFFVPLLLFALSRRRLWAFRGCGRRVSAFPKGNHGLVLIPAPSAADRQSVPERTQFPTLPHLPAEFLRVAEIGELGITFGGP
jgi:hypothetical protein